MSIAFCSLSPKFLKHCLPVKLRPNRVLTFSKTRKMVSSSAATAIAVAPAKVQTKQRCNFVWLIYMSSGLMSYFTAPDVVAADQDYQSLCDKLREISTLGGISGLLQWDEAVMMPAGAAESRGKQKSVLAGVVYEKVGKQLTAPANT